MTPTLQDSPRKGSYSLGQLGRIFWPYFRPFRKQIIGAVLALVMVAGALLIMGRGFAYLVDEGLSKQDPELLDWAAIATALIALCLAFGSYLRTTLVNQMGEQVVEQTRKALFAHVVRLAPGWFEKTPIGDILARITTDTAIVQTVMTSTISMAARNLILLVGGLVMLVLSSPKMSIVVLLGVPLVLARLVAARNTLCQLHFDPAIAPPGGICSGIIQRLEFAITGSGKAACLKPLF